MVDAGRDGSTPSRVFPEPAVVVGIGRFGLAVLEKLGTSWSWLNDAGVDASIENLRLVHLRSEGPDDAPAWRNVDGMAVVRADLVKDGDTARSALNMAILRTLGFIRFHGGMYQVAVPRDAGAAVLSPGSRAEGEPSDGDEVAETRRARYFEWLALDEDPVIAADLLRRRSEREKDLDLFITPVLERVRNGHSPGTILACVRRAMALAHGRDPSPWGWSPRDKTDPTLAELLLTPLEREDELRSNADWKLPGGMPADPAHGPEGAAGTLRIPAPMVPGADDSTAPTDPRLVLSLPWQLTGWTMQERGATDHDLMTFTPLKLGWLRLGMYDGEVVSHGQDPDARAVKLLPNRLKALADGVYRGLLTLFIDMRLARIQEYEVPVLEDQGLADRELAIDQSLEILGEFLIRPLGRQPFDPSSSPYVPPPLPETPSPRLVTLQKRSHRRADPVSTLDERLRALGALEDVEAHPFVKLFDSIRIDSPEKGRAAPWTGAGMGAFRNSLRKAVDSLYSHDFQARTSGGVTRRVRRLAVYLVGDFDEPFVRTVYQNAMGAVHAELLRDFGPLFQLYREGFDRTLAVVPIVWISHSARAPEQETPLTAKDQLEQAQRKSHAVLEALFNLRRRIEEMPRGQRCVSQILINSRVNERSVLSHDDAARQTHDYVWLQLRAEMTSDPWLQSVAIGPSGRDFLGCFSCVQAAFPAERATEYLANRLARICLRQLVAEPRAGKVDEMLRAVADRDVLLRVEDIQHARQDGTASLEQRCGDAGDALASSIRQAASADAATDGRVVAERLGPPCKEQLREGIQRAWHTLTEPGGDMDRRVDDLRRIATQETGRSWRATRTVHDRLAAQLDGGRVVTELVAAFRRLAQQARERLRTAESDRRIAESACAAAIPDPRSLEGPVDAVAEAAKVKPDRAPMVVGWVFAVVLAPAVLAPVFTAVARWLELDLDRGVFEAILGPGAPVLAVLLAALTVFLWLRWLMRSALKRLDEAAESCAQSVRDFLAGPGPSVLSFLDQRHALATANALRGAHAQLHAWTLLENELAKRIERSVLVQQRGLQRRVEELGVQPAPAMPGEPPTDDVSHLFEGAGGAHCSLLQPADVLAYYHAKTGDDEDPAPWLADFVARGGGFRMWRTSAPLSEEDAVLSLGREAFRELREKPVFRFGSLGHRVADNLDRFVRSHYQPLGFGTVFTGYEGLDTDGVRVLANGVLLVPQDGGEPQEIEARTHAWIPEHATLTVRSSAIPPNSVYLLSVAQGITAVSARNLLRYDSYHDRSAFPGSSFLNAEKLHMMTRHQQLVTDVHEAFSSLQPAKDVNDKPARTGGKSP
jgi:hypothetical protein